MSCNHLKDCLRCGHYMETLEDQLENIRNSLGVEDIIAWADGILGSLGTENASKVTEKETAIAKAIIDAQILREINNG